MREIKNIKKMINRANTLKEYDKQNTLSYFEIDDFIYDLSPSAIKDIKAHAQNNKVYFKDLQTSTLIELSEIQ